MAIPSKNKQYHEKDLLDRAIDDFSREEKPNRSNLDRVKAASQVLAGINAYRAEAKNMTPEELEDEAHDSTRLGDFMTVTGDPRPHELCDAHAIISGGHTLAGELRAILAWFARRIDDPVNGCWLPRNTAATTQMPLRLKKAVPHSRIHRIYYYRWLNNVISLHLIKNDSMLLQALKMVEFKLQTSSFPYTVMLSGGKEA